MEDQQQPTTIAILGADTVVENALAQLLEGEGYATRVLKPFPLGEALVEEEEMPLVGGGADLVVLAPSLSTSECDAFLADRRRTSPAQNNTTTTVVTHTGDRALFSHEGGTIPPRRGGGSREECAVAYLA